MNKELSILSYIQKQARSKNLYFVKRIPKDARHAFNGQDKVSVSLKTADMSLAKERAYEELEKTERKIELALKGTAVIDLTRKTTLADLTPEEAVAIEQALERTSRGDFILTRPNWNPSLAELLAFYADGSDGKHNGGLMSVFPQFGILLNPDSEIYSHCRTHIKSHHLRMMAEAVKDGELDRVEAIDTGDEGAFQAAYFQKADRKIERPTLSINAFMIEYAAKYFTKADDARPTQEETRFTTIIKQFASFTGNMAVNHITSQHIDDFFNRLARFPVKLTSRQQNMTFVQITDEDHGQKTLTVTTAGEWFIRLNRFFEYAVTRYKSDFTITNPMAGMKKAKIVQGSKKVKKRAFLPDEIHRIYTQPEFTDFDKSKSWGWLMLGQVLIGNRLSEMANRKVEQVQQDKATGIWFVDVPQAKNDNSERQIPVPAFMIDIGFLDFVEAKRNAGETYLFPDEADGDPDSKAFARRFGRWQRSRGLWKKETTLHNLRSTFITASKRTAFIGGVSDPALVVRKITGHAIKDAHEGYADIYLDTMKLVIDQVRISGFPYDQFTVKLPA